MSDFFYTMTELCPVILGQTRHFFLELAGEKTKRFFKSADLQPVCLCVCVCADTHVCVCNLKNNVHILQVVEEN